MVGRLISPMVTTVAPTMPVDAARSAPTMITDTASPPLIRPNSDDIVLSMLSARPDFSNINPIKTNNGTARSTTFCIVPIIRNGSRSKKSGIKKYPIMTDRPPRTKATCTPERIQMNISKNSISAIQAT